MLRVEGLTKRYGDRLAVNGVSFTVDEGEIVGFLGPNGAGKSTTLRMITGYLPPSAGAIQVGKVDALADPRGARKQIGYMPEGVPLYPEMRVAEYLRYRAELKGVPKRERPKAVEKALEMAGVTEAAERVIGQLSKGYRQRVGFADALVADPPLLILDEPSSGLDPNQIRAMRSVIRGLAGKKTVLLSTHILPEVEATCERVVIINGGELVGEGAPTELRERDEEGAAEGRRGVLVTFVGRGAKEAFATALADLGEPTLRVQDELVRGELTLTRGGAEEVFRAGAEAGLVLRELTPRQVTLEDVFAHLTTVDRAEHDDEEDLEEDAHDEAEDEDDEAADDEAEAEDEADDDEAEDEADDDEADDDNDEADDDEDEDDR